MALITRQIGNLTEVSTNRGGYYITQSFPTNFHQFFTAKILGKGEKVEDYKEVSEAEKQSIENKDKEWVKPSDELIKEWDLAWTFQKVAYGKYNESTGFFEGNYINDLTELEARDILKHGYPISRSTIDQGINTEVTSIRTALPMITDYQPIYRAFKFCFDVESVRLINYYSERAINDNQLIYVLSTRSFSPAPYNKLRLVFPILGLTGSDDMNQHFYDSPFPKVERIYLHGIHLPMDCFSQNTTLKLECWQYMIANATNTSAITIKVHADVMARILDETNTEWHQLLVDATTKNIQFAV